MRLPRTRPTAFERHARLMWLAVAMLGLLAVAACKKKGAVDTSDPAVKAALEAGRQCAASLREPSHEEARAWCAPARTENMGFELSKEQMLAIVEEFYAAGAARVEVVGIEPLGDRKVAAQLAVLLPQDILKRNDVLALTAKFDEGDKPTVDARQSCLLVNLD